MLTVQKQPDADTLVLDQRISKVLSPSSMSCPKMSTESEIFRQSHFINAAVNNVSEAVRDGAVWCCGYPLSLLMGNFRTSLSSLTSMPLSIMLTVIVFYLWGITINTMTWRIAVAIATW